MSWMGQALVNLPLSDKAAIRASGFYRSYGGYIDSIGTGGSDVEKNINDSKSYGGRISALIAPSDTVSIRLTALLQDFDRHAAGIVLVDPPQLGPDSAGAAQSKCVRALHQVHSRPSQPHTT